MALDPIATLKQIAEVVKKYNDLELTKQIVDLQSQVFDVQQEKLSLARELADLKAQLDLRQKMHMRGPHNYYYMEGDDEPFCPACWERDLKAIHLSSAQPFYTGGSLTRNCRVCKEQYFEGGGQRGPSIRGFPGPS
jgi:hypothetical protein